MIQTMERKTQHSAGINGIYKLGNRCWALEIAGGSGAGAVY